MKAPYEDDCENLKQVLKYLNGIHNMKLTLMADELGILLMLYLQYMMCIGHKSAMMKLKGGAMTIFFQKAKNKCKTSTEAELIQIDDRLPSVIWTKYYIEA